MCTDFIGTPLADCTDCTTGMDGTPMVKPVTRPGVGRYSGLDETITSFLFSFFLEHM